MAVENLTLHLVDIHFALPLIHTGAVEHVSGSLSTKMKQIV